MTSGTCLPLSFQNQRDEQTAKAGPAAPHVRYSKASSGFSGLEHSGRTCRAATRRTRPVTAAFRSGCVKVVLKRVLEALATELEARGGIDLSECFIDGTFVTAKKGAQG
jgi:hypothetical protein